jgi:hypothetical protein
MTPLDNLSSQLYKVDMEKNAFGFINTQTRPPASGEAEIGFTVHDASAATGCQESALQFWSGPGRAITPGVAVAQPKAPRLPKLFDTRNLVQIRVLTILSERGLGQEVWRALQQSVPQTCWDLAATTHELVLLTNGTEWHYYAGREAEVQRELARETARAHDVVVINLTRIKKELHAWLSTEKGKI